MFSFLVAYFLVIYSIYYIRLECKKKDSHFWLSFKLGFYDPFVFFLVV